VYHFFEKRRMERRGLIKHGAKCKEYEEYTVKSSLSLLVHGQNLNHADKYVDEIKLQTDGLVDSITLDKALLTETGVVKDLLHVIEGEASKDNQTSVEPEVLGKHQRASCCDGEDERSQAGQGDNGNTSEKWTTNVEVFFLLGCGTNKGETAHQTDSVETGTSEDGGVVEHERSEEGGLSQVEGGPKGVFRDVAGQCVLAEGRKEEERKKKKTHFSGGHMRVPIMVPMDPTRPIPMTSHGLADIRR
jgi:hypothetical protein